MGRNVILKAGENCLGIHPVGRSGILVDARDYYRAFLKAAVGARNYILMAGWQFDSDVRLLRGADAKDYDGDVRLLPFLKTLCERNPGLNVYILAWDFTFLFSLDREWFQKWIFETWGGHERIHFLDDESHAVGASHHQKLVVIDGTIAFAGGMDICAGRWDDRLHRERHPERVDASGDDFGPVHDVQACVAGPAAEALAGLFLERWAAAGGDPIDLPPSPGRAPSLENEIPLEAGQVAVSRTRARTVLPRQDEIREIRSLYLDAIDAAERFIYIENQYFTSRAVHDALLRRFEDAQRPGLSVAVILPRRAHTMIEQASLACAQENLLASLAEAASLGGHRFGAYSPVAGHASGDVQIYIHSKILIVDDRFLSVGSANTTNRSMGLDTELNLSWEAAPGDDAAIRSIRGLRLNLLAEHAAVGEIPGEDDLVGVLEGLADRQGGRLRRHSPEVEDAARWMAEAGADEVIDSENPLIEEQIYEILSRDPSGFFARGLTALDGILEDGPPGSAPGRAAAVRRFLRYVLTAAALAAALALLWFLYGRG